MVRPHPTRRLHGVAVRVGRCETEIGATIEPSAATHHRLQPPLRHVRVNSGDEQPLAHTVLEESNGRIQPVFAPGERHDRIGTDARRRPPRQLRHEDGKADQIGRQNAQEDAPEHAFERRTVRSFHRPSD